MSMGENLGMNLLFTFRGDVECFPLIWFHVNGNEKKNRKKGEKMKKKQTNKNKTNKICLEIWWAASFKK